MAGLEYLDIFLWLKEISHFFLLSWYTEITLRGG